MIRFTWKFSESEQIRDRVKDSHSRIPIQITPSIDFRRNANSAASRLSDRMFIPSSNSLCAYWGKSYGLAQPRPIRAHFTNLLWMDLIIFLWVTVNGMGRIKTQNRDFVPNLSSNCLPLRFTKLRTPASCLLSPIAGQHIR